VTSTPGTLARPLGDQGLYGKLLAALYRLGVESGPVVSETSATAAVRHAAAGKLSHTMARYQAALAAAEESVQRAQATLATAEELLRRARDLQNRFRELQGIRTQAA
jgi:hypothetical protein